MCEGVTVNAFGGGGGIIKHACGRVFSWMVFFFFFSPFLLSLVSLGCFFMSLTSCRGVEWSFSSTVLFFFDGQLSFVTVDKAKMTIVSLFILWL